jgi:prepilin-type N-terminal cleavage/methylation domain-containing protein
MWRSSVSGTRKGFTLVELAVVIVIIGVLAAFGVPRFLKSVERTKASEAFAYLSAVRSAQERYIAKEGNYAIDVSQLDIQQATPKNFTVDSAAMAANGTASWALTLTRNSSTSSYGAYTVKFTENGFVTSGSTILTVGSDITPLSSGYP